MRTIRVLLIAIVIIGAAHWSSMTRGASGFGGDENEVMAELRRVRDIAEEALSEARHARDEARALRSELAEVRGKVGVTSENLPAAAAHSGLAIAPDATWRSHRSTRRADGYQHVAHSRTRANQGRKRFPVPSAYLRNDSRKLPLQQ